MKSLLLLLFSIISAAFSYSQSNSCSSATPLSVTANCSSPTSGTTLGATQSISGCSGNADDDVWYSFVASSSSHQITVVPIAGMDPVVQLFSGPCSTLISLICKDSGGDGVTETINYTGLTPGNTYTIRVYHYLAGSGTGNFTICVTNAPAPPSNDNCSNAISLSVNASCSYTFATTEGATQSAAGCAGFADDDVWFSFVATNSLQNIEVSPIDNLDLVFQVYSGSCASLSSLDCVDETFSSQSEQSDIVGLVPGQTYYVRVYDYYQGTTGDFNICITGTATAAPTNDEPCNAIQIPEVTATCQYSFFTTNGATTSVGPPTPASCAGGSAPQQGGFQSGTQDVWFAITVPASGNVDVSAFPNGGAGYITDGVMALYSGTCGSLTQIACSDDNNYPGSGNDYLPFISESGLLPGSTVYLRYWDYGLGGGEFGICVSTITNDDCANALYICDINGYSASTSASYTPDRPDNMRGNNEDINGNDMPNGTNTGGIFGQGGAWGSGAPFYDVVIDNNSWIKFTAASTSATLTVDIYDCWVGNYPSGGIQMQVFEGTNCTNFVPVSNFEESSTGFIITANNLTVGNDYYLMVDGYAGDICNYTITANFGVQFPDITDVAPICEGESVTLQAPAGAISYEWQHDGSGGSSVTVTPSTTETYYCEVTGLCDYKQLLDVVVTVNSNPNVTITNGATASICSGDDLTLTAAGASVYDWNPGAGSSITVSPTSSTSYTVTGTDGNGCSNDATIAVTVNVLPTLSVTPTATDSDCGGSTGALTGAVASGQSPFSYEWSDGSSVVGNSANLNNVPAGNYYLSVEDGNFCSATFGPYNISNPGAPPAPSVTISDATPCINSDVTLTATSGVGGVSYSWSGPNGFSSTNASFTLTNVTITEQGNYCVSVTSAGCTGPSACQSLTIQLEPLVDVTISNDDSTICMYDEFTLTGNGAVSYSWSGPNGFSSSNDSETIINATSANEGYYFVNGTDAEGCIGSDSIIVTILSLPIVTIDADNSSAIYCSGNLASLSASGGVGYEWLGPNGFSSTNANITLTNLDASDEGYYTVSATDSESCSNIDSIYVLVITNVPATSMEDTVICPGEVLILSGDGGISYIWNGPAGYYSEEQNPTISNSAEFTDAGLYVLTVVDTNGCLGYDTTNIDVSPNADCLTIPNLFTPDLDGYNDTWEIYGLEQYLNAEVEIYNRWGNMVYYSSPYNNDWDGSVNQGGTIDGKDGKVPVGTYFYIIRLNEEGKNPFKGYVEVQY